MDQYRKVAKYISDCHRKSLKVVLLHGVFDLLHVGHLNVLTETKKLGDILVVGVDSDDLVKSIKGTSRPIVPLENRMQLVEGLKPVDMVFGVELDLKTRELREEYFQELYGYLNIDVVASGKPDYWSPVQLKICNNLGIQYVVIGDFGGSTSEIIARVASKS